jgi:Tfp pilus assembly protein PilO
VDKDLLARLFSAIPSKAILGVWIAYQGFLVFQFRSSDESELNTKVTEVAKAEMEVAKQERQLAELDRFVKELESRKEELKRKFDELDRTKVNFESFDIPSFMQAAVNEAKRLGIQVQVFRPTVKSDGEFYEEQGFEFGFRGFYPQLMVFLSRLSKIQHVVQVESFTVKPVGARNGKFVQLEGSLQIKGYSYKRSKADDLKKSAEARSG